MDILMPWDRDVGLGYRLGVCWPVKHSKTDKTVPKCQFLGHQGPKISENRHEKCPFLAGNQNWVLPFEYVVNVMCSDMLEMSRAF